MIQQFHFWVLLTKTLIQKDICTPMFTAVLLTVAKMWKQSVSITR